MTGKPPNNNICLTKNDAAYPEKTVRLTSLDKPWFNPGLKLKYNEMQNEFFRNGKTPKWKTLKYLFKVAKRKASEHFYNDFVSELKGINPSQNYKIAKLIGAVDKKHTQ